MVQVHALLPCWRRRSMHAMLILEQVTLQTSRTPDMKLYLMIEISLVGGIDSMWWPYPSDMILQLMPKVTSAKSY
jgi:hypothetical protein